MLHVWTMPYALRTLNFSVMQHQLGLDLAYHGLLSRCLRLSVVLFLPCLLDPRWMSYARIHVSRANRPPIRQLVALLAFPTRARTVAHVLTVEMALIRVPVPYQLLDSLCIGAETAKPLKTTAQSRVSAVRCLHDPSVLTVRALWHRRRRTLSEDRILSARTVIVVNVLWGWKGRIAISIPTSVHQCHAKTAARAETRTLMVDTLPLEHFRVFAPRDGTVRHARPAPMSAQHCLPYRAGNRRTM